MGAGHYGIFSGRRWRDMIYPQVRDFIRRFEHERIATAGEKAVTQARRTSRTATSSHGASARMSDKASTERPAKRPTRQRKPKVA
jgi:poly(3-hydroxybutyrate) depolymerase